jgi:hypothetical protein
LTSVFNLEVYARHEFFVGEAGVRAHNAYSAAPPGFVRYFHGTDRESARAIAQHGLRRSGAEAAGGVGDQFWLLGGSEGGYAAARSFAEVNPAGSSDFAVIAIDVPAAVDARLRALGHIVDDTKDWGSLAVSG